MNLIIIERSDTYRQMDRGFRLQPMCFTIISAEISVQISSIYLYRQMSSHLGMVNGQIDCNDIRSCMAT